MGEYAVQWLVIHQTRRSRVYRDKTTGVDMLGYSAIEGRDHIFVGARAKARWFATGGDEVLDGIRHTEK